MTEYSQSDLFVVVDYDYFGEPSSDGKVYVKREDAENRVAYLKEHFPTLTKSVMDLEDFITECRDHQHPDRY